MILPDGKKKSVLSRLLSREELALWRHVVADVIPRAGRKTRRGEIGDAPPDKATKAPAPPSAPAPPIGATTSAVAEKPARREPPPLAPIEKKLRRSLASGRQVLDDRIDLHGMTQAQAHHALIGFIHRAVARDARVVLVITGKGGAGSGQESFREISHGERGVLRRAAPLWLREPSLRGFVLSVEEASRAHGGAGALYVRLRRNRQG